MKAKMKRTIDLANILKVLVLTVGLQRLRFKDEFQGSTLSKLMISSGLIWPFLYALVGSLSFTGLGLRREQRRR